MSFLHPKRSPCSECDNVHADKDCDRCRDCDSRKAYAKTLDPENLNPWRRSAINWRVRITSLSEESDMISSILSIADDYCDDKGLDLDSVLDTTDKSELTVRHRHGLICHVVDNMPEAKHYIIGQALGLNHNTIGYIVRKQKN
jgi:hypothetical protein